MTNTFTLILFFYGLVGIAAIVDNSLTPITIVNGYNPGFYAGLGVALFGVLVWALNLFSKKTVRKTGLRY